MLLRLKGLIHTQKENNSRDFIPIIFLILAFTAGSNTVQSQCDQLLEELIPSEVNYWQFSEFEFTYIRTGWTPFVNEGGQMLETVLIETSPNISLTPISSGDGWIWNSHGWSFDAKNDLNPQNDLGDMNDSCTWQFTFHIQIASSPNNQECLTHVSPYSDANNGVAQNGQMIQWSAMPIATNLSKTQTTKSVQFYDYFDFLGNKMDWPDSKCHAGIKKCHFTDGSIMNTTFINIADIQN